MKQFSNTIEQCEAALKNGEAVYAKDSIGDWIQIDAINPDGLARVADALSGLNSGTIGQWMKFRDYEVA